MDGDLDTSGPPCVEDLKPVGAQQVLSREVLLNRHSLLGTSSGYHRWGAYGAIEAQSRRPQDCLALP